MRLFLFSFFFLLFWGGGRGGGSVFMISFKKTIYQRSIHDPQLFTSHLFCSYALGMLLGCLYNTYFFINSLIFQAVYSQLFSPLPFSVRCNCIIDQLCIDVFVLFICSLIWLVVWLQLFLSCLVGCLFACLLLLFYCCCCCCFHSKVCLLFT